MSGFKLQPGDRAGLIAELARRLKENSPSTAAGSPRRLVVFAGENDDREADQVRALATGTAACCVLAKSTATELVVVDLGAAGEPFPESPQYRCRRIRRPALANAKPSPLTIDELRAAFVVGQQEADRAHCDCCRLVAASELAGTSVDLASLMECLDHSSAPDRLQPLVELSLSLGIAASAGFFARAAELGLGIVLDGPASVAAALAATHLYPATSSKILLAPGPHTPTFKSALVRLGSPVPLEGSNWEVSEGAGALLAFPLLDAASALAARERDRETDLLPRSQPLPSKKVAIFTGTFDPPTTFHRRVVRQVRGRGFDEVIVRPSGPRTDQSYREHAAPIHRAVMVDLAFRDLPGVTVDLADLDEGTATHDYIFDDLYRDRGEVWHIVSADFVCGGKDGSSAIQTRWNNGSELWRTGRFVVLHQAGSPPDSADLPKVCQLIPVEGHVTTADLRLRIFQGGDAGEDVPQGVASYLRRYRLFSDSPAPRETRVRIGENPRFLIVADESNPKVRAAIQQFRPYQSDDPVGILVLGGDGTMLGAIRKHWRKRLPFLGLNAGHHGFLMNETLPADLANTELVIYHMPMLRVDIQAPDGRTRRELAYVDAWLERNTGQAAWLRLDVDGRTQVPKVVGDGLLVATPSGSSAYARAMGATPVPLTAPVITLAGSNVFRPRFWKPVALPEHAVVKLTSLDETGKRPVRGFLDGEPVGPVSVMEVRMSSIAAVELAFTPQFDLSTRLLRSLFPPSEDQ